MCFHSQVESNNWTKKQIGDRLIDGELDDSYWGKAGEEMEALNKKKRGLMNMDNSVVIAGGRGL